MEEVYTHDQLKTSYDLPLVDLSRFKEREREIDRERRSCKTGYLRSTEPEGSKGLGRGLVSINSRGTKG